MPTNSSSNRGRGTRGTRGRSSSQVSRPSRSTTTSRGRTGTSRSTRPSRATSPTTTSQTRSNQDISEPPQEPVLSQSSQSQDINIPIRATANEDELREALRTAQLTLSRLHIENQHLAVKVFKLQEALDKMEKQATTPAAPLDEAPQVQPSAKVLSMTEKIGRIARKFFLMNEPFVPHEAFMVPCPVDAAADHPDRWATDEMSLDCLIAELYDEVPVDLHEELEFSSSFCQRFTKAHGTYRRIVVYQLRNQTAAKIFQTDTYSPNPLYYTCDFDRSTLDEFRNRLYFDPSATRFSKYCPLLYPDGKRIPVLIFKALHLPLIIRSIAYGPKSLGGKPSPSASGFLWGLKTVTPGAIALAAILAIFLHSPDKTLEGVGDVSGIHYYELFCNYKEIITVGLSTENPRFVSLLQWYNTEVFSWEKNTGGDLLDGDKSGIDEAFEGDDDLEEPQLNAAARLGNDDEPLEEELRVHWGDISYCNNPEYAGDLEQQDDELEDDLSSSVLPASIHDPVPSFSALSPPSSPIFFAPNVSSTPAPTRTTGCSGSRGRARADDTDQIPRIPPLVPEASETETTAPAATASGGPPNTATSGSRGGRGTSRTTSRTRQVAAPTRRSTRSAHQGPH
ncbi:hypothetical protein CVT24_006732 [Panaeolus cyanescens]|uniref:Uncharacterized protein n=1 Tax=Panaeolus cyanescens TaxID=181874 RepID=A0A409VBM8_9AGAR|nr:hypothetical protein CVT24_006732 [Panaeolus cyanescens]